MPGRRILCALCGGIAAYKIPDLVRRLRRAGHDVRCALSDEAARFAPPLVLQALSGRPVRQNLFDPGEESEIDHIGLADWADLVVLAPATANTLAKLTHGLADDLVSALLLATRAPVLAVPAMNVHMWEHPATQANVADLRERGVHFLGPESGELACGWEGLGRMAEPQAIAERVENLLGPRSLAAEVVLVTAGGTREPIDAVRVLANRSSGKLGFAVAAEAARRGAEVVLLSAPSALPTPLGVRRVDVETALEMRDAVRREFPRTSVVVMAAAVSDFRAKDPVPDKLRKRELTEEFQLSLVRNPDILAEICREKGRRVVVGFAAETEEIVERARHKLQEKGCDLVLANDVVRGDGGFESDHNAAIFVWPEGDVEELPLLPKSEVAVQLVDRIEKLLGARR